MPNWEGNWEENWYPDFCQYYPAFLQRARKFSKPTLDTLGEFPNPSKMKATGLITFITLMAVFVKTGFSIQCYVCNSHYNKDCTDVQVLDLKYKQNCTQKLGPEYTACRKTVQNVLIEINGVLPEERVIRACAMNFTTEKPCNLRHSESGQSHTCHCFEDLCNSAPTTSLSMAAILIFSLIVRYF